MHDLPDNTALVVPDLGPRPDTSGVDEGQVHHYVSAIGRAMRCLEPYAERRESIRQFHGELRTQAELFTVVLDRLAKQRIISKALWREFVRDDDSQLVQECGLSPSGSPQEG